MTISTSNEIGHSNDTVPEALIRRDEFRRQAMIGGDVDALEDVLHERLAYVHSSGLADSKESYLAPLRERRLRYGTFEQSDVYWQELASTVYLARGRARARVLFGENVFHVDAIFTAIWVNSDQWRMTSWQSTPWAEKSSA